MAEAVPFVEFEGSHFEIGRQLGAFSKEALPAFLESERVVQHRKAVLARPRILSQSLKAATDRYPKYMEELTGIASGADRPFQEIFIFNWRPRPRTEAEGCTTLIVPRKDRILLAHNEDWRSGANDIFMARLKYEDGLDFLGVTYHGYLPGLSASINQYGLVQALNNLTSSDGCAGVPLTFINRASLEATSIDEAVAVVTQTGRADSENFNFAHGDRAVMAETSALEFEVTEVAVPVVHTNHFLVDRLLPLEASSDPSSSLSRYARATALLAEMDDPGLDDLRAILSSHEDALSICRHGRESDCDDPCDTLGTILVDTRERTLDVCYGTPCRSRFHRFAI